MSSMLESLVVGVSTMAFPQFLDQATNAKLVKNVWGTGVRVSANEEVIVEHGEIVRCLDLVIEDEEKGKEVRKNVEKW
ncbi:hypothetical protein V6N13_009008 [Hibiscus sabdariffa]|uniref:Uncharacterized protein n=1 Tax=Hibiscus sabdariffa TaxID=183260 RepID=A0ABR2NR51_9ROSI